MENLKFRAWHKRRELIAPVRAVYIDSKMVILNDVNSDMEYSEYQAVELMQFTGSYDDNKKEIYVGDIMLCDTEDGPCLYQIKFGTTSDENILTSFYFDFIRLLDCYVDSSNPDENDGNEKDIELYTEYNPEDKSFIVIGNIYQNPELLEVRA